MLRPGTQAGMGDAERLDFIVSMTNLTWPAVAAIVGNFQTLTGVGMRATQQLNAGFTSAQSGLLAMGGVASIALYDMTQKAMEFNREMAMVKGLIGDITSREMAQLSSMAKKLATDFGEAPSEIARGFQMIARAGIADASDQIKVLTNGMRLAKIEGYDVASAVQHVITATNLFGDTYSNVERYASAIAHAANVSVTSAPKIAEALKYVGGAAKEHFSIEETLAAIATLSQKGVEGSTAGISIRSFMVYLMREMPKSQKALTQLGLSFDDFWVKAGNGTRIRLKPLQDIIMMMSQAANLKGMGRGDLMRFLAQFGEPRQMQQYIKLFPTDEELKNGTWQLSNFNSEMQKTYDMQERLNNVLSSTQEKWNQFTASLQAMEISIGEGVLPGLSMVLDLGKGVATAVSESKVAAQGLTLVLTGLAASAGILAVSWAKGAVFHMFSSAANKLKGTLGELVGVIKTVGQVSKESAFDKMARDIDIISRRGLMKSSGGLYARGKAEKSAYGSRAASILEEFGIDYTPAMQAQLYQDMMRRAHALEGKGVVRSGLSINEAYKNIMFGQQISGGDKDFTKLIARQRAQAEDLKKYTKRMEVGTDAMNLYKPLYDEYRARNEGLDQFEKQLFQYFSEKDLSGTREEQIRTLLSLKSTSGLKGNERAVVDKLRLIEQDAAGGDDFAKGYMSHIRGRMAHFDEIDKINETKEAMQGNEVEFYEKWNKLAYSKGPKVVTREMSKDALAKNMKMLEETQASLAGYDRLYDYINMTHMQSGFAALKSQDHLGELNRITRGMGEDQEVLKEYIKNFFVAGASDEAGETLLKKIANMKAALEELASHQTVRQLELEKALTEGASIQSRMYDRFKKSMGRWGTIQDHFPGKDLTLGSLFKGFGAQKGIKTGVYSPIGVKAPTEDTYRQIKKYQQMAKDIAKDISSSEEHIVRYHNVADSLKKTVAKMNRESTIKATRKIMGDSSFQFAPGIRKDGKIDYENIVKMKDMQEARRNKIDDIMNERFQDKLAWDEKIASGMVEFWDHSGGPGTKRKVLMDMDEAINKIVDRDYTFDEEKFNKSYDKTNQKKMEIKRATNKILGKMEKDPTIPTNFFYNHEKRGNYIRAELEKMGLDHSIVKDNRYLTWQNLEKAEAALEQGKQDAMKKQIRKEKDAYRTALRRKFTLKSDMKRSEIDATDYEENKMRFIEEGYFKDSFINKEGKTVEFFRKLKDGLRDSENRLDTYSELEELFKPQYKTRKKIDELKEVYKRLEEEEKNLWVFGERKKAIEKQIEKYTDRIKEIEKFNSGLYEKISAMQYTSAIGGNSVSRLPKVIGNYFSNKYDQIIESERFINVIGKRFEKGFFKDHKPSWTSITSEEGRVKQSFDMIDKSIWKYFETLSGRFKKLTKRLDQVVTKFKGYDIQSPAPGGGMVHFAGWGERTRERLGGYRDSALRRVMSEERAKQVGGFLSLGFLSDFKTSILGLSLGSIPLFGAALAGLAVAVGGLLVWWNKWNQEMEIYSKKMEGYKKKAATLEQQEDQLMNKAKTAKTKEELEAFNKELKNVRGSLAILYDRMAGTNRQIYKLRASNPEFWPMFRESPGPQWYGGGPLDWATRALSPQRWASGENIGKYFFGVGGAQKNQWMTGSREQMLAEAYTIEKQRSSRMQALDASQKSQAALLEKQRKEGRVDDAGYRKQRDKMLEEFGDKRYKVGKEFDRQLAPIVGSSNVEAVKRLYRAEEKMQESQMLLANAVTKLIGAIFALIETLLIPLRLFGIGPDVYSPTAEEGQQPGQENISQSINDMATAMEQSVKKIDEVKKAINDMANGLLYAVYQMTYGIDFIASLIQYASSPSQWLNPPSPFAESKESWEKRNKLGLEHKRPWYPGGSTEDRDKKLKEQMEKGLIEPTTGLPYDEITKADAAKIEEINKKREQERLNQYDTTLGTSLTQPVSPGIPVAGGPPKKTDTMIGGENQPENIYSMSGVKSSEGVSGAAQNVAMMADMTLPLPVAGQAVSSIQKRAKNQNIPSSMTNVDEGLPDDVLASEAMGEQEQQQGAGGEQGVPAALHYLPKGAKLPKSFREKWRGTAKNIFQLEAEAHKPKPKDPLTNAMETLTLRIQDLIKQLGGALTPEDKTLDDKIKEAKGEGNWLIDGVKRVVQDVAVATGIVWLLNKIGTINAAGIVGKGPEIPEGSVIHSSPGEKKGMKVGMHSPFKVRGGTDADIGGTTEIVFTDLDPKNFEYIRERLLSVVGIGEKKADSMLKHIAEKGVGGVTTAKELTKLEHIGRKNARDIFQMMIDDATDKHQQQFLDKDIGKKGIEEFGKVEKRSGAADYSIQAPPSIPGPYSGAPFDKWTDDQLDEMTRLPPSAYDNIADKYGKPPEEPPTPEEPKKSEKGKKIIKEGVSGGSSPSKPPLLLGPGQGEGKDKGKDEDEDKDKKKSNKEWAEDPLIAFLKDSLRIQQEQLDLMKDGAKKDGDDKSRKEKVSDFFGLGTIKDSMMSKIYERFPSVKRAADWWKKTKEEGDVLPKIYAKGKEKFAEYKKKYYDPRKEDWDAEGGWRGFASRMQDEYKYRKEYGFGDDINDLKNKAKEAWDIEKEGFTDKHGDMDFWKETIFGKEKIDLKTGVNSSISKKREGGVFGEEGDLSELFDPEGPLKKYIGEDGLLKDMIGEEGLLKDLIGSKNPLKDVLGKGGNLGKILGGEGGTIANILPKLGGIAGEGGALAGILGEGGALAGLGGVAAEGGALAGILGEGGLLAGAGGLLAEGGLLAGLGLEGGLAAFGALNAWNPLGWGALAIAGVTAVGGLLLPALGDMIGGIGEQTKEIKAQTGIQKKGFDWGGAAIGGLLGGIILGLPGIIIGGILGGLFGGGGSKATYRSPLKLHKGFSGPFPDSGEIVFPQLDPDLFKRKAIETGEAMGAGSGKGSNIVFQPGAIVINSQDHEEIKQVVYNAIVEAGKEV